MKPGPVFTYFNHIVILTGWYLGFFYQSNTRGTVKDKSDFKVEEDVSALRKAIEGLGKSSESVHFIYVDFIYCKNKSPQNTI